MTIDANGYAEKVRARNSAADALAKQHPHLERTSEFQELKTAARNIRMELKLAYPSVKFSVRLERFSMGNAIRIHWEDGPTESMVDEIAGKYKDGYFDGSDDSYKYTHSVWTDAFGSAKYVTTSRNYSDAFVCATLQYLVDKRICVIEGPIEILGARYKQGELFHAKALTGESLQTEIYRAMHKRCAVLPIRSV
jgi:hypothetical protein